jgi:hypothetical protein
MMLCSADTNGLTTRCAGMEMVPSAHPYQPKAGLSVEKMLVWIGEGKAIRLSTIVMWRVQRHDEGLMINFCPWCGKPVAPTQPDEVRDGQ